MDEEIYSWDRVPTEDIIQGQILANTETKNKRIEICKSCPHLMMFNMCEYCKCLMNLKVQFQSTKCPKGLW